eukprot:973808_1
MSLFKLSTLLVITWCWWLSLAMTGCPNEGFKMVARYKQGFKLNSGDASPYKRYWIAFGSKGQWVINLVDSKIENEHDLHYACSEKYFAFSAIIKENNPPICCAAPHSIDQSIQHQPRPVQHEPAQPTQSHAFAVLPNEYYTALHTKHALQKVQTSSLEQRAVHHANEASFVWMQKIKRLPSAQSALGVSDLSARVTASMLWPMKMTAEQYQQRTSIWSLGISFDTKEGADTKECIVNAQWLNCDTGITNEIVVFHLDCENYSLIRFGFSSDGIFRIGGFLDCTRKASRSNYFQPTKTSLVDAHAQKIRFFPISKLYPEDQQVPSYSSIGLGWKLGAFCGSCPSISFTMKVSEQEAQSNKERLQHALASTLTLSSLPVSVKYTRTWYKESAVTLASGRATTITASCNGLDLYYWSVGIGTWGAGDIVIPTQFFYCTDRNTPPVCKPRITAAMDNSYGLLCCGQDQNSDFDASANPDCNTPKWQTPHGGRPTPIRLQGQRDGEGPLKVEQQAGRAAARIDYIDRLDEEDGTNDKGLFVASVTYDGDDDSDMGAQNAYIPSYSLYNGDFLSTTDNTNVFIPFIIVLFVLCALCIAVIACIGVVGCFAFRKHTSIQKNTVRLNKVTPYKV